MYQNDKNRYSHMDTYPFSYRPLDIMRSNNTIGFVNINYNARPYSTSANNNQGFFKNQNNVQKTGYPDPQLVNVDTKDITKSIHMSKNSYLHQPSALSEDLHNSEQFSNTHLEPITYPLASNNTLNFLFKNANIKKEKCPYSTNSSKNTVAIIQPITQNFYSQCIVSDNENSAANIKPDMLSNLIRPKNLVSNSAPCNYSISSNEDQISSKIPNVNQNGRTNTNYNKYGENLSESFLCQNQDIGKQNTCPYPPVNNVYPDILMSTTNNLSNPMQIYQINSKHEVFENLNGPNYSSRITYENKSNIINQEV
ncbi:hypothetical protein COBT_000891 [Conglomerata obtusa]